MLMPISIPNWKGYECHTMILGYASSICRTGPSPVSSTMELKAFDLAQGAASHVSAIGNPIYTCFRLFTGFYVQVTTYRDRFSLKRSSPFLPAYILSAAYVIDIRF